MFFLGAIFFVFDDSLLSDGFRERNGDSHKKDELGKGKEQGNGGKVNKIA